MSLSKVSTASAVCGKDCFYCTRCAIYGADIPLQNGSERCFDVVCEIFSLVPRSKGTSCRHFEARDAGSVPEGQA